MENQSFYRIGEVASACELPVETIRYYEKQGLLRKPKRTAAGYRLYTDDAIQRLRFVSQAKQLGFSLREIRELLSLRVNPRSKCSDVKKKAERKIAEIEDKIKSLEGMRKALHKLSLACSGKGPASECPILETLESPQRRA